MYSYVVELSSIFLSSCKHLSGCQTVHWLLYMDLLQFQFFSASEASMLSLSMVPSLGLDYMFEFDFLINTVPQEHPVTFTKGFFIFI